MNHSHIDVTLNENDYAAIVSLGNKCPTAMILSSIGLYHNLFPFDWIPSTPELILKYMKDQTDYYPQQAQVLNKDGLWFGHFDIWDGYEKTIGELKEGFNKLLNLLKEKKPILFVYTSEADMYNEFGCRYRDNYRELRAFRDYISSTYGYTDFKILAIHTNKTFDSEPNFIHYTINVDEKFLSNNGETHVEHIFNPYRLTLRSILSKIFRKIIEF
jgi:hypothetical protein